MTVTTGSLGGDWKYKSRKLRRGVKKVVIIEATIALGSRSSLSNRILMMAILRAGVHRYRNAADLRMPPRAGRQECLLSEVWHPSGVLGRTSGNEPIPASLELLCVPGQLVEGRYADP